MSEETLKKRVEEFENKLGILQDVQAIRKLHHLYGYFIDKCMYEEAVDCFADECEFHFFRGIYRNKTGIRRAYCDKFRQRFTGGKNGPVFGFLLDHPMMQDVVDVAPDRQTAKARFRCMMMAGTHYEKDPNPSNVARQWWEGALYENTYIRIDGVWKIKVLNYRPVWHATFEDGWAFTPPKFVPMATATYPEDPLGPDEIADYTPCLWPDHEVMPFHCNHPVTGKPIVTPEPGIKTGKKNHSAPAPEDGKIKSEGGDMTRSPAELEAEVLRLKKMVEEGSKANDYLEIWQLMSMYSHLYHAFKRSEVPNLFAQKTPGVEVEIEDSGVYEGIEGVRKVFCGILADERHKVPGFLGIHMTCNPVIEMNNGRTEAKGLWHSHGCVTLNQNGQLTSFWCLGKYDMTFVKEDGQWKILKMFYRLTYMSPYEKGWVEEPQGASITVAHAKFPPDRPCTYHMPYNRHRVNILQPLPPKPYEGSCSKPHMESIESTSINSSENTTSLPSHHESESGRIAMDKILRIDVSAEGGPRSTVTSLGEYAGMGGRGMTTMVVNREVPADCHPLGIENKLVIAPGLMTGSAASTSGRISVGCKSPLTGGIKEANAGGQAGQVLARLGYAAIILEGEARDGDLYQVLINKDKVEITPANDLKMMPNYELAEKMKARYGEKTAMISIGPAGEMKMCAASIAVTDREFRPTRHAARGGVGAVMGAKGIKAIILDDAGCKMRSPHDPEGFKTANKAFVEGLRKHAVTGEGLPTYGTNVLTNVVNEAGAYPTYNFKTSQYADAFKISGEALAELETNRGGNPTHGCHAGCAIRCSGIFVDKDGNYVTKQPEYETVWAHGGNCGICDLDAIAKLDYLDDNIGLDTIEMGVTLGVAMAAGLIEFGDHEGAIRLLEEVGKGTPTGRILGNGAAFTAKAFGIERAPVVKNQAMPAYDPRAVKGIGVTYATSTMGADHTAGYAVATNILKVGGDVDPLSNEGQIELSRNLQIATAALDATGYCLFIAFAILDQQDTFDAMVASINTFHNLNMTGDDVVELGKKILSMERDFNKRAGFTKEADRLPSYFQREVVSPHNVTFDIPDEQLDEVFNW